MQCFHSFYHLDLPEPRPPGATDLALRLRVSDNRACFEYSSEVLALQVLSDTPFASGKDLIFLATHPRSFPSALVPNQRFEGLDLGLHKSDFALTVTFAATWKVTVI